MSETVEKVLDYLGEKPRKAAVHISAARGASRDDRTAAAKPARSGSGHFVVNVKKPRRTVVIEHAGGVGRVYRAPQLTSAAVDRLAAKLSVSAETLLYVSDISERTFQRRQANQEPLTEAESDRVLRIARVAREAERVFGTNTKASRWLSSDNRILGARPLDLLATDAGARDVEHELVRIDHGDFA